MSLGHQCISRYSVSPTTRDGIFQEVEHLWQLDVLPYQSKKLAVGFRQVHRAVDNLKAKPVRVPIYDIASMPSPSLDPGYTPINSIKEGSCAKS